MHVLAARPVAELQAYEQYTAAHGLPLWRIEHQLALISMQLAATRAPSGTPLKLSDYLIRPYQENSPAPTPPDEPVTEAQAKAVAEAMGFNPQNRRKPPATTQQSQTP